MGPCSIDDYDTALVYAEKLACLSKLVEDRFFIVMRTFIEKSRSSLGWRGFLHDPDKDGSCNYEKGLFLSQKLLDALTSLEMPAAVEIVDPFSLHLFKDEISYGVIGARSCQSPSHRYLASSCPFPIGFKNGTDGNIDSAIDAVKVATERHQMLSLNQEGNVHQTTSSGNPYPHVILRGGIHHSNFQKRYRDELMKSLPSSFLVDVSHGNCEKNCRRQIGSALSLFHEMKEQKNPPRGIMIESYLEEGCSHEPYKKGCSITDPCLSWKTTEYLIQRGYEILHTAPFA